MRKWFLSRIIDATLPLHPVELGPEDKLNLGQFYNDDTYKSYRKLMQNYEFLIRSRSLSCTNEEREHYRGQLYALKQIESTLKRINKQYKKKS